MKVKHCKKEKSNLKIELQLQKVNLKVPQLGGEIGIEVINRIYIEGFKKFLYYYWIMQYVVHNLVQIVQKGANFS